MEDAVNFDRASEFYDATRGFPPDVEDKVGSFIACAASLSSQSRVLEIGIGTGRIAIPVSRHVDAIFGVDISEQMLARLRKKSDQIQVARADARYLPFSSRSFDAVLLVHILHLIPEKRRVIREIERVLRPGGVVIQGHNHWTEAGRIKQLWDVWQQSIPEAYQRKDWIDVNQAMPEAGWHPVSKPEYLRYSTFQSPLSFLENLRNRRWSSTWRLSDTELTQGLTALNEFIQSEFGSDADQPIEMDAYFCVQLYQASHAS